MGVLDEFHSLLTGRIERRRRAPEGALLTFACLAEAGTARPLVSARWLYCDTVLQPRGQQDYGALLLGERWYAADAATKALFELLQGLMAKDGLPLKAPVQVVSEDASARQHRSGFSEWPEWRFTAHHAERDGWRYSHDPLVRSGLRPYKSIPAAIQEWIWGPLTPHSYASDIPHKSELVIVLPDPRGRIVSAEWAASELRVAAGSASQRAEVEIQSVAETARGSVAVGIVSSAAAQWPMPAEAMSATVYLVDKPTGDLLDSLALSGPGEVTPTTTNISSADQAILDHRNGESVEVEFKSFVTEHDTKEAELIKTVVAFANTRGGRLYLGIRDDGTVQDRGWVPKGVSFEDAVRAAETRLKKIVHDKIKPVPPMAVERVELAGEIVLVAQVARGEDGPYSTHENDVYVRKGATSRKPDPKTELPTLYPQPVNVFASDGTEGGPFGDVV